MRVIAFIEYEDVIKKILNYLGLWEVNRKPSPQANVPPFISDSYPTHFMDDYVIDPDTPVESNFYQTTCRKINGKALPKTPVFLLGWAKIGRKWQLTTRLDFCMKTLIFIANNGFPYVEVCMSSTHNHRFSIYFS